MKRIDGRACDQLREITITPHIFEYAPGSVLFAFGKTKVLCSAMLTDGVPPFLRGKGVGWLTAEYAMMPAATLVRTARESVTCKRNGRNVEISRLIGRALRATIDFEALGEKTITIDCDVMQADGSTRCAAICGAQAALNFAVAHWTELQLLPRDPRTESIVAVSAGILQGQVMLDLSAYEDNQIDTDFTFVLTAQGSIVELQGTAEQTAVTWEQFAQMSELARQGAAQVHKLISSTTP